MTLFVPWPFNRRLSAQAKASLAGALLLLPCISTLALELGENAQIHGFASQAFTMTSDNQFFGETTDGSLGYTELGINGSYRPLPSLMLSAQVLSRHADEVDDGDIRLDYGFVDFTALSNEKKRWGIRAGRMKNPYGLYNETRDVSFTRPSIFLPQGIYFEQVRPLVLSSDGVGIYGEERSAFGDLQIQANIVRLDADNTDTELAFLSTKTSGHFENDYSFVGQLLYEYDAGRIRSAISYVNGTLDYKPSNHDFLRQGKLHIAPLILSFQYNAENWSFTTEYLREELELRDFGPVVGNQAINTESYYFQGSYRFYPGWEAMLRYDAFYPDKDDKSGKRFAGTGLPSSRASAVDWTAGLRWDVNAHMMIRAEYHRINGTASLPLQDNPDPSQWVKKWNMFSLQLSFRF